MEALNIFKTAIAIQKIAIANLKKESAIALPKKVRSRYFLNFAQDLVSDPYSNESFGNIESNCFLCLP
ncbi:MAG: hypothetical protein U7127_07705 [Phormidium sp.]